MKFLDDWAARTVGHANTHRSPDKTARSQPCIGAQPEAAFEAHGLFVLGTDTDVGKTYVTCLMARHLADGDYCVGVYKPVASGLASHSLAGDPNCDPVKLCLSTNRDWPLERVCPQSFRPALAPPMAAELEGQTVSDTLLLDGVKWWQDRCEILLVEGAGGALSPLSHRSTVLDLASRLDYPVVLVAQHRLGMMNHILLTMEALARRQLKLLAVIINQTAPASASNGSVPELQSSLACLLPFCDRVNSDKIDCWVLPYQGSTLFPARQSDTITDIDIHR